MEETLDYEDYEAPQNMQIVDLHNELRGSLKIMKQFVDELLQDRTGTSWLAQTANVRHNLFREKDNSLTMEERWILEEVKESTDFFNTLLWFCPSTSWGTTVRSEFRSIPSGQNIGSIQVESFVL